MAELRRGPGRIIRPLAAGLVLALSVGCTNPSDKEEVATFPTAEEFVAERGGSVVAGPQYNEEKIYGHKRVCEDLGGRITKFQSDGSGACLLAGVEVAFGRANTELVNGEWRYPDYGMFDVLCNVVAGEMVKIAMEHQGTEFVLACYVPEPVGLR